MTRRAVLALAVLAAGCSSSDLDDYPIGGGGGGGGGPSIPGRDGGTGDGGGGGGATLLGRVCVVGDLRRLTSASPADCRTSGVRGSVVLGASAPVMTDPDGSFEMPVQEGSNLSWRVTGTISPAIPLIPSTVPAGVTQPLLPAVTDARYLDLLNQNGVVLAAGQGAVVARILRGGAPVMSLNAEIDGGVSQQTLYDSASPEVWGITSTGPLGIAWIPDELVGPRTLRIFQGATTFLRTPVTISEQSITFVTIALPPL